MILFNNISSYDFFQSLKWIQSCFNLRTDLHDTNIKSQVGLYLGENRQESEFHVTKSIFYVFDVDI